ncbi:hypothetical protein ACRAWD_12535 [Caulobacter segnis]
MAVEGKPAAQTLTYAGQTYAFQADGRGEERVAKMIVAGKPYDVTATEAARFRGQETSPAGGGLPAVLPKAHGTKRKEASAPAPRDVPRQYA